jgi:hypothetical protein
MSAAELMAELDRDPGFVAGQVDDLVREEANRRRYREAAAPVLAELADAGFAVDTVGQLRRSGIRYTAAVPILTRWMSRVDYRELQEDIVRSLAVPWAREAAPALLAEFRAGDPSQDPPDTSPRWVVGLALSAIADRSLADDLIELAADPRWGAARGMIVQELGKTGDPRTVDVLLNLLDDTTVSTDAIIGLGKIGEAAARPALERFLTHPDSWIRKEAKKAVARIDRKANRGQKRNA